MTTDLLGLGSNATNVTTTRPGETRIFTVDTFAKDCTSPGGNDGTRIPAAFLNGILMQLRQAIRQAGITEDNTDDLMLWKAIIASNKRTQLTANTTFYVSPSGSNTTGLGTAGAPWQTIQYAVDQLAMNYDQRGYTATIACAAGPYTGSVVVSQILTGPLVISGDTTTPTNCVWSTTSDCLSAVAANVSVQGFKFLSSAGSCLKAYRGGLIILSGNSEFGACSQSHMYALDAGSRILIATAYKITGGGQNHLLVGSGCAEISSNGTYTVTLTGTPAFSGAFAYASNVCVIRAVGLTFSGAATGTRYGVTSTSEINTGGGGASFFPGNAAGTGTNYL